MKRRVQAFGTHIVRFHSARQGPQVSSSFTASEGTPVTRAPAPPVQANT